MNSSLGAWCFLVACELSDAPDISVSTLKLQTDFYAPVVTHLVRNRLIIMSAAARRHTHTNIGYFETIKL